MRRRAAVLRPEPGNAATAARLAALGWSVVRLPLFAVHPVAWPPPDPEAYDALVLTSANAVRHGGSGLAALTSLPVYAVGPATARAAEAAGFTVAATGVAGAAAMLADARDVHRALHLGGRDRTLQADGAIATAITVYASDPVPDVDIARLRETVALVHSARAARRLAALVSDRAEIRMAALSESIASAAGPGWERIAVAAAPTDAALCATAAALAD